MISRTLRAGIISTLTAFTSLTIPRSAYRFSTLPLQPNPLKKPPQKGLLNLQQLYLQQGWSAAYVQCYQQTQLNYFLKGQPYTAMQVRSLHEQHLLQNLGQNTPQYNAHLHEDIVRWGMIGNVVELQGAYLKLMRLLEKYPGLRDGAKENQLVQYSLGRFYMLAGRYEEAGRFLQKFRSNQKIFKSQIVSKANRFYTYMYLAQISQRQGNKILAYEYFHKLGRSMVKNKNLQQVPKPIQIKSIVHYIELAIEADKLNDTAIGDIKQVLLNIGENERNVGMLVLLNRIAETLSEGDRGRKLTAIRELKRIHKL